MIWIRSTTLDSRSESGLSLVELLVSMMMAIVVTGASITLFTGTLKATRKVNDRTQTVTDARIALEQMGRELRVAIKPKDLPSAFSQASTTSMTFYSLIDRGQTDIDPSTNNILPYQITYAYDDTCINITKIPTTFSQTAGWGLDNTKKTTSCLIRTSVAPEFSYYSSTVLDLEDFTYLQPATGAALSADQRQQIASVQVDLTSKNPANFSGGQYPLVSRVSLTNVIYDLAASATISAGTSNTSWSPLKRKETRRSVQ